jgi:hypothetical protein
MNYGPFFEAKEPHQASLYIVLSCVSFFTLRGKRSNWYWIPRLAQHGQMASSHTAVLVR